MAGPLGLMESYTERNPLSRSWSALFILRIDTVINKGGRTRIHESGERWDGGVVRRQQAGSGEIMSGTRRLGTILNLPSAPGSSA